MSEALDRLPGLHALRLIAAFGVFVLHVTLELRYAPALTHVAAYYFALGVPLFYVVSAFALMHSTRVYDGERGWLGKFYAKRFWRIAPLFYVMCVITSFWQWQTRDVVPTGQDILVNVFFLFNLVPQYALSLTLAGWSVGVEMLFYVIFPLLFLYVRSLRAAAVLLVISVVAAQAAYAPLSRQPMLIGNYAEFAFITFLPCFALGVLAYLAFQRLRASAWGAVDAPITRVVAYHAFFAVGSIVAVIVMVGANAWLRAHGRADILAASMLFAFVSVWLTVRRVDFLNWAPIQFLGERSYSLYLLHPLIILYTADWGRDVYLALAPSLGVWAMGPVLLLMYVPVAVLSALTYALIEKPGMKFGKALGARFGSKPRAATEPA